MITNQINRNDAAAECMASTAAPSPAATSCSAAPSLPTTMRSARYFGQHDVRVAEEPVPACEDDGVLIRTIASGVCGTDAAVWSHGPATGHRVEIGGQLGHETVARVVAVGKNVQDFEVGQRVYPYPLLVRGDARLAGMIGGFTDYIYVPKPVWGESLYTVDERIPDKLAAFIEPFTVGYHAARQAAPAPGDNAVVFGAGTIGIAAALGLERLGAANVLVCDISPLRLSIAEKLGFATCNTAEEDAFDTAAARFGTGLSAGAPAPNVACYVDAAGADSLVEAFIERGMVDSRLALVAVSAAPRTLSLLPLTYGSKAIAGSGGYRADDVPAVMALMAEDPARLMPMITHEYPLEQIADALDTAVDATRSLAVCVCMEGGDRR